MEKIINTVLFPTDFSDRANSALGDVIKMSQHLNSKLILFHSYARPVPKNCNFLDTNNSLLHKRERHIEEEFSMLKEIFPELKSIEVNYVKSIGLLVDKVKKAVNDYQVDLILMPTKGARGFEEFWGSNTHKVAKIVKVPVLALPDGFQIQQIPNIGIATNFDSHSNLQFLDIVKQIADAYNSQVHIVRVHTKEKPALKPKEVEIFDKIKHIFKKTDFTLDYSLHNDVESGIIDFCEKENIQLVCVLPTKRNFLEELFHESLTQKLTYHLKLPLLILN